jgi:hypothetical protein
MTSSLKSFSDVLAMAGTAVSLTLGPIAFMGTASAAPKLNPYSPTLISRYTSQCAEKLSANGKTPEQAQKLCQCSMTQMQMQKTQSQAIAMLMVAKISSSIDPKTGLPSALSPYFAPCKA